METLCKNPSLKSETPNLILSCGHCPRQTLWRRHCLRQAVYNVQSCCQDLIKTYYRKDSLWRLLVILRTLFSILEAISLYSAEEERLSGVGRANISVKRCYLEGATRQSVVTAKTIYAKCGQNFIIFKRHERVMKVRKFSRDWYTNWYNGHRKVLFVRLSNNSLPPRVGLEVGDVCGEARCAKWTWLPCRRCPRHPNCCAACRRRCTIHTKRIKNHLLVHLTHTFERHYRLW